MRSARERSIAAPSSLGFAHLSTSVIASAASRNAVTSFRVKFGVSLTVWVPVKG